MNFQDKEVVDCNEDDQDNPRNDEQDSTTIVEMPGQEPVVVPISQLEQFGMRLSQWTEQHRQVQKELGKATQLLEKAQGKIAQLEGELRQTEETRKEKEQLKLQKEVYI